ncbi:hypothetical protein [Arcobacter roscoffensis]|uniref:Uncharacterized protein n=1 Tax=Arcobacter roscoffensis TaxID=2961520 RepID=A0ABY5EA46_9BACT|nr:hypothetical protein [Arcobacter roscoffensis]UTJ07661.1 hypothetical protein NJU99_06090 [Arcobacter roscoffensis]
MSFLENLKEFFTIAKQTNFDLAQVYAQTPNGVYSTGLVLLVILLVVLFFIRRSIKISSAVKLASQIQNSKDINEYNEKLDKLAAELPKRGLKVAQTLNAQKNEILEKELELLEELNIKEKIDKYTQIASKYELIAKNSKKYAMNELTSYYDQTAKKLLEVNLIEDINTYSKNAAFNENDLEFVNSIVKYANTTPNPDEILNSVIKEINSYSYAYNLDLVKFTKALTKDESKQVYENCTNNLELVLTSGEHKVSEIVLSYLLEENKEDVYNYISTLENKTYLEDLYHNLFAKKDDIDLDLAFVANETKTNVDYASFIDKKITDNWKDLKLMKHIIKAPRVLETIGHVSYRSVLERIEKLETQEENNKTILEALQTARRAEALAKEAKDIARSK